MVRISAAELVGVHRGLLAAMIGCSSVCVSGCSKDDQKLALPAAKREAAVVQERLRALGFVDATADAWRYDSNGWRQGLGTTIWVSGVNDHDLPALIDAGVAGKHLHLYHTSITNMAPIVGAGLIELRLVGASNLTDTALATLRGAGIRMFGACDAPFSDLTPLADMPLLSLVLDGTQVRDLSTIAGMNLRVCGLISNQIHEISALAGMPLENVAVREPAVTNISVLSGAPLQRVDLRGSGITDLTPLSRAPLEALHFDSKTAVRGIDAIRKIQTLRRVNGMPADEFWAKYDARKTKKNLP